MTYIKEAFAVVTLEQAMNTVLSTDPSNPDKFNNETTFLIDIIAKQNIINSKSMVLDFGCGMGRVSKKIIDMFDCRVIGVDISNSMMQLAHTYIMKPYNFKTINSYNRPNSIDVCISTFVLQHVEDPKKEIDLICSNLKQDGYLVIVNENNRLVPCEINANHHVIWKDDGFNVFAEIETKLNKVYSIQYMNSHVDVVFYKKTNFKDIIDNI